GGRRGLQAPTGARVDEGALPARTLLVTQDLRRQTATLRDPAAALVAPLPLRGLVQVTVSCLSAPVTLCGPPADLDSSPCLLAGDVRIDSPLATLDRDGTLRLPDAIAEGRPGPPAPAGP